MTIEAHNRLLPDWFTRIRTRQLALPRFQRFEAWGHANVTQLFNTILQDLPIGAVLVLEVGDEEPFISRVLKGAPAEGERITEQLLDGQQRLTALWRGLHNNYAHRTYFLHMSPDEETGMPYYIDSLARWRKEKSEKLRPFWANDHAKQWERRMIPLDLFAAGVEGTRRFREWAEEAIPDRDERDEITDDVSVIRGKLAAYNLPYLSLPVTTDRNTALDVFIKMNTSAAPLTIYDIVVAQIEAGMGTSLHDLVGDARSHCPVMAEYYSLEDLALYAGALIQGRPPTNATYLSKDFATKLLANWDSFLTGVSRAAAFLEDEKIYDAARLPTDVVVPVLVALWAVAPTSGDAEGRARTILRKYLWRAFFSNRYEKSTSTRSLADYSDLLPLVAGSGDASPTIFDDEQHPIPQLQELTLAGWPKNKDRAARAILAIALREGGLDLADASPVSRENLAKREYHHLFPAAHLKRQDVPGDEIFRSLNCAVVTWQTNRHISDKEPERYLAERRDGTDLGEQEVKARLASHLIPYEEMVSGDYNAFLKKRAELIYAKMTDLCESAGS